MSNSQNILVRSLLCLIAALAPAMAGAQNANGAQTGAQPPVAYASVSELNGILEQLKQTTQSMQSDLQKTRIEKWKTDSATKRLTLANVESIQRNLQSALPETIAQLNNSPEDLGRVSSSTATWLCCMTTLVRWWRRRKRSGPRMSLRT